MRDERIADHRSAPGDDVQHAGRQSRLVEELGDLQRCERRRRGGLDRDRVAGCKCRPDLRAHQRQRIVVGHDCRNRADRALDHHAVGAPEGRRQILVGAAHLRCQVGVVLHTVNEVLELARSLDRRLSLLVGQRVDDLVLVRDDEVERLADDLCALLRVGLRPPVERFGRRLHRKLHGIHAARGNTLVNVLGRGIDDVELVGRGCIRLLAPDQHLHHRVSSLTESSSR